MENLVKLYILPFLRFHASLYEPHCIQHTAPPTYILPVDVPVGECHRWVVLVDGLS